MSTAHSAAVVEKYSINNHLEFHETPSGLMKVRLLHESGGSAEIYLYGAHITSWKATTGSELLFLSRESRFQKGIAIRGGIPLIFPQFGGGTLLKHGFARVHEWDVCESGITNRGDVFIKLRLGSLPEIYELWPYQFSMEYTVTLGESLTTGLRIVNESESPFSFTTALHTYFAVSDVRRYCVEGLQGCEYHDKLSGVYRDTDNSSHLRFSSMIDRIYLKTPRDLILRDCTSAEHITIKKVGFKDAVIWNPWQEGVHRMKDFGDEEYLSMLCIEAAQIDPPITLTAGEFWVGVQVLHHAVS
jgi:glucose-6-phosphate 1-epimerase